VTLRKSPEPREGWNDCNTEKEFSASYLVRELEDLPVIDIVQNLLCSSFAVNFDEILLQPCYEMILEGALDHLMKQVRRD
jgi:hypothetical protein